MFRGCFVIGDQQGEKKNLKSYVLDDSFPARAGSGVENFPFFSTIENLKVAVSVKTQVCLVCSAVSN